MNKNILFTVFVGALAGCATKAPITTTFDGCKVQKPPQVCSAAPRININVNGKTASPRNFCAKAGDPIEFKITGGAEQGTVAVIPKDGKSWWLARGNSPDADKIIIDVPVGAFGEFSYVVMFPDESCLDPRISIADADSN